MQKTQRSISEFNNELKLKGFKAFKLGENNQGNMAYSRKDFYKICLTTGKSRIHYSDKSFAHEGTILFFGNPHIPYSWETLSNTYEGYTLLFSEEFLQVSERSEWLHKAPLFKIGGTPILEIQPEKRVFLNTLFEQILKEQETDYSLKDELIRNYIQLIIHEAIKLQPSPNVEQLNNGAQRLTAVFLELLERQFPIETPTEPLQLKTANQYAEQLSVHVNYLNRAVKTITGKSTSTHISDRILVEAKALLQHTNWNVSEVAHALGFEYPTYFNNFFKKQTGISPKSFRVVEV